MQRNAHNRSTLKALYILIISMFAITLIQTIIPRHTREERPASKVTDIHGTKICIIARTFQKQYPYLLTFLLSISHNKKTMPRIFLLITDTESSVSAAHKIAQLSNSMSGYNLTSILPITEQDAKNANENYKTDYGYGYTDAAIDYFAETNRIYKCDYLMFTNADNLYVKGFLDDYILDDMRSGIDLIAFDFVSHYKITPPTYISGIYDDGTRKVLPGCFIWGRIDLGAVVIRAKFMLEDAEMRFVKVMRRIEMDIGLADGFLVEYAAKMAKYRRIHRQVLLVHQ